MKDFLKRYQISLKVLTPVHIGSGEEISKKEYVFYRKTEKVLIPNQVKLFADLQRRRLGNEFQKFMMYGKEPLLNWLRSVGYQNEDIRKLCSYELDCAEALDQLNRPQGIRCFVKDPYGMPYIPGSSLKGALRRVLLAEDLLRNSEKYRSVRQEAQRREPFVNGRPDFGYLKKEGASADVTCFRTLGNDEKRQSNAINDVLQGLRISDSKPIDKRKLTLCQKVDVSVERKKKPINTLRESLKPGTEVVFDMVIDSSVLKLDAHDIEKALQDVSTFYADVFVKYFEKIPQRKNEIYLGGGSGYGTKTIAYELLDDRNRVKVVSNLMHMKFDNYKHCKDMKKSGCKHCHKHCQDVKKGVSPHMLKCTKYGGNVREMGRCQIEISSSDG